MATALKGPAEDYKTADLYFAAYLKTAGVEMKKTERVGQRVFFIFDGSLSNIPELKDGWFSDKAKVSPLSYSNNIKALKSMCHMA